MPNKNYLAGVRFEREVMKDLETDGWTCFRTAGSHGQYDVIAIRVDRKPLFIQCKRVTDENDHKRLVIKFRETAVTSQYFHQQLAVRVKGATGYKTLTV
jgi:Holliday junction resolvase